MAEKSKPPRITKRVVDALQPGQTVWDSEVRGFGARRQRRDVSYVLKYSSKGRQRFITIGKHGPVTAEAARLAAKTLVGEIASGGDPASARDKEEVVTVTVQQLCLRYLDEGPAYKPNKKQSSWRTDRSNITQHVVPLLGHIEVGVLTEADVTRFVAAVSEGLTRSDTKTGHRGRAIVRGGAGVAARALAVMSAVLAYGMRVGLCTRNVTQYVQAAKGRQPGRYLSRAEWLRLGRALREAESSGVNSAFLNAIRLLSFSGARRSEVTRLQWTEVDLTGRALHLKTSKSGPRVVPIGEAAFRLLQELDAGKASAWVFPSSRGEGPIVGLQKVWTDVRTRAGLDGVRLHDLRHSFASEAISAGASLYLTGAILGHRQPRTTQRYAHIQSDPARAVADAASRYIGGALDR